MLERKEQRSCDPYSCVRTAINTRRAKARESDVQIPPLKPSTKRLERFYKVMTFWNRRDTYNNDGTWPASTSLRFYQWPEIIKFFALENFRKQMMVPERGLL